MAGVENLRDLVLRRARELGSDGPLSTREIARRSDGKVSYALVGRIMNGEYSNTTPGQTVIDGLAKALAVPVKQVERAAGAPPSYGTFQLDDDAARLTPTQRRAVKAVVQAMLDPGADATATEPAVRLAARRGRPENE